MSWAAPARGWSTSGTNSNKHGTPYFYPRIMNQILFYCFGALSVFSALMILFFRNPVTSAISMVVSFVGMAALFVTLDAHFLGVMQILVYTGAVMVLFLFIIMLLNVKQEEATKMRPLPLLAGLFIVALFLAQFIGIIGSRPKQTAPAIDLAKAATNFEPGTQVQSQLAAGNFPDAALLGQRLFSGEYNAVFLVTGLILVVATIGVVALSRRPENSK